MSGLREQYWVAAGLALMLTACAAAREEDLGFSQPAPAEESVLVVQNDNLVEMDIYAVMGSTRARLGSVPAGQTAKLRLSRLLVSRPELLLQADPIGPQTAFTFPVIPVRPGVTVGMLLASSLAMSAFTCIASC